MTRLCPSMILKITLSRVLRAADTSNGTDQLSVLLESRRVVALVVQHKVATGKISIKAAFKLKKRMNL